MKDLIPSFCVKIIVFSLFLMHLFQIDEDFWIM